MRWVFSPGLLVGYIKMNNAAPYHSLPYTLNTAGFRVNRPCYFKLTFKRMYEKVQVRQKNPNGHGFFKSITTIQFGECMPNRTFHPFVLVSKEL